MYGRKKNMYHSVTGRNVYIITKVVSIPILLAISALAMVAFLWCPGGLQSKSRSAFETTTREN